MQLHEISTHRSVVLIFAATGLPLQLIWRRADNRATVRASEGHSSSWSSGDLICWTSNFSLSGGSSGRKLEMQITHAIQTTSAACVQKPDPSAGMPLSTSWKARLQPYAKTKYTQQ
ncbi:unnamed protein product [Prorocentrum cordatum]|uniref:Secreted protein n=1 Tax=Prorocentrum cordatum TaxID=2364126 RepID=A0ABN9RNY7_9DINO|nr:unnamed protein product [Polarella glacialis]